MKPAELQSAMRTRYTTGRVMNGALAVLILAVLIPLTPVGSLPTGSYSAVAAAAAQLSGDNPIVVENQQPGSGGWIWSQPGNDVTRQIKGFASATSVRQNQSITFHVTVNPAQTYTIDFYRIGWYAGAGGRHRLRVGPLDGVQQPPCNADADTGLMACSWTTGYTLTVPSDWTSGVYVALLTNAQGYQNYVTFVVRDSRPAAFLYQRSVATDLAYNNYPNDGSTGKSLIAFNSYGANTVSGTPAAVKVSFDRPMADSGLGLFLNGEINLVRWLERSGYDVTYATDIDTHANGAALRNHRAFLSTGQNTYWSREMFDAAEGARDNGVNLAFFGANAVYTQVRFEASAAAVANRVMVCYRNLPWNPIDPVQGPTTTTEFRHPPVNRPEQPLIGIQTALYVPNIDYVVTNSSHWVYAGTGFQEGDAVPGIVGSFADSYVSSYPPPNSTNHTLLSRSPYTDGSVTSYANSSIYQAPSGAWVFAAGTLSWSWALDDVPGPLSHFRVDSRIQRATANILNAFLAGAPRPTITSFAPTSGRVGTSVTINGTSFTEATAVRFNGTAASFTVSSATAIQATVPPGATTGPLSVTTAGGTATSAATFTVVSAPTITSFTPTTGPVQSIVTISGTSFTGTTAVTFNGTAAGFTVTSDTAIRATVPTEATTGPLSVTTPEGTATSTTSFTVSAAPSNNPIVLENQQPGSAAWIASRPGDDTTGQIKGYASATSVSQNQTITFHVSVNPEQTYTMDIYRIGWYGGLGGRLRLHVGPLNGVQQAPCVPDANTGLIACNWAPAYTLTVPSDWTSGVYFALLTNAQGYQNYVVFVVRDGRPAQFLYQQSVATDQAYNNYPNDGRTGKSLYSHNSFGANTTSGSPAAVKVSSDRPMADSGVGQFTNWELNLVRWLERSGYDVTYSTNIDTHANGDALRSHRAFLSGGHDEYWSKEMFDAAEAARDSGVNLAFFGGNAVLWQVRFEPSATGAANRVMVCYRPMPWNPIDPVQGPTSTTYFRAAPVNRPEQSLLGIQSGIVLPNTDYVVSNSSHWIHAGTGFRDGDVVPGILGYEADLFMPDYPAPNSANHTLLSRSPYLEPISGLTIYLHSSIYQAPSGAWVFHAGTMSWSWALEDAPHPLSRFRVDARIQQTTANLLNAFLNGAPSTNNPIITSLTPRSGRVGTSVTIAGRSLSGATAVRFNGTAASFTVTSDTAIQAIVPAGATTGPVSVTTAAGTATSVNDFRVVGLPTIVNINPRSGRVGIIPTIYGSNFTGATQVTFNGAAAMFAVNSDTAIQAIVPAGATTGPVTVTTPEGTTTSTISFTVVGVPVITSITPTSGQVGTSVTISGTSFTGATAVTFNGTAAAFTVTSDTTIQTAVPTGATTGPLTVTTPEGTGTSTASFTVGNAPTITSFTPPSGPVGSTVTISGTNFTGATAVTLNGTAASFTVTSATTIQATVPAGATTGPLSVTAPGGTATSATNFTVVVTPPTIESFTPMSGPVGTAVTISGTNFTGATAVTFNGSSASFTVTSATSIQTSAPAGATSGAISVTTSGGTATSATTFTVVHPPTIAGFAPESGPVETGVTISGTNFTGATAVTINGTAATFTVTSATSIQTSVPAGATSGAIRVTTPGGTATSASSFTVVLPPTVASFAPASGPVGTAVTISGTNFTGATAVTFNGTNASFTVTSATSIQTSVPAGATSGALRVTTAAGTATSAATFTVVHPPTIASFAPASGPVGTSVTISGTNFTGATAVTFNETNASFTVTSATAIQTSVPAGATSGALRVTTAAGTATSAAAFTVVHPPTIASFTPATGPVGTSVMISGTNFTGATAVTFNGRAASFTVTSATAVQATVPAGATTGLLSVTTPGGTAFSDTSFTVLHPPTITVFTPTSGLAGMNVTITGTNFTGTTAVLFNGTAASFMVTSATAIQATVPAAATSGPLSVTTPVGTATSATNFTVRVMLSVTKTGLLGGTVTSSPSGINCGGTCSAAFDSGAVVTLTASPALLSLFTGWTGCDTVSGTTCTVTMNRARAVTARFLP